MSESNNVRFVENNGKWMWKHYDEQGSVIFRSPAFDTEREAREDYDANGDKPQESSSSQGESNEATNTSSESAPSAGTAAPEGDTNAGSASADQGSAI